MKMNSTDKYIYTRQDFKPYRARRGIWGSFLRSCEGPKFEVKPLAKLIGDSELSTGRMNPRVGSQFLQVSLGHELCACVVIIL